MVDAPLHGLRVLETATGIAGPYAGRLLAMLGADVVKLEPAGGDPARTQPIDDKPVTGTSPLFVHLNAGKRNVAAIEPGWAHVVIDDRVRADLDPDELTDGPKLVSVTAWGIDGPSSGRIADELIVQAQSGFLGFNRDPGDAPLRLPGWPAQYMAGALAAVGAMATVRGDHRHVDVSWLAAFLSSTELAYADALHCERRREPVGAHPPTAFPSGAIPCADGFVAPGSIRAIDWEMQCLFYERPDLIEDPEYTSRQRRVAHIDELWDIIRPWYSARTKREIFQLALDTPWAVGMVMTPTDAVTDPHLDEREFLQPIATPDGEVRGIGTIWRGAGLPVTDLRVSERSADPSPGQDPAGGDRRAPELDLRRLDGLRLIEMTVAWAGPYVGNLLSPLGVDVVKLEAQAPFDGWRALRPYDHGMRPGQEEMVEDNRFFEASGLFNALNRGKRDCVLSLASDEGRDVFLDLVRSADGIVANFSAHVLPSLGLDWATLEQANPGLVVVRMPAFGIDGPYSGAAGYGSIVEAMGGIGHRQGYEREGARISNIYYPDPVAGVHAAVALLAGLHRRDLTGAGCELDLSHQEATWSLHGDALVLASSEGRDVERLGNREPAVPVSGVVATADERWVAVVGPEVCRPIVDGAGTATADALMAAVDAAGGSACEVLDPWTAPAVDPVRSLLEVVDHPVTGPVRHVASPFRLDGSRPATRGPAPLFDQHTDEVLSELAGYDSRRLAALREDEVIGGELPPPATLGYRF
ncbi:MAG: CoA transferase [Acidimicrobiia bacterium]|nr:CoA transferase [Acidimicrobiia bacterium]